jgi:hypothetical protein
MVPSFTLSARASGTFCFILSKQRARSLPRFPEIAFNGFRHGRLRHAPALSKSAAGCASLRHQTIMKKDNEVEKSVRETTDLIKETRDVFQHSVSIYLDSLTEDLNRCMEKLRREGMTAEVLNELAAIAESTKKPLAAMRKNQIRRTRELKVVPHKNEAHANDRLFAALERMRRDAKDFEDKMEELAARSERKVKQKSDD